MKQRKGNKKSERKYRRAEKRRINIVRSEGVFRV